MPLTIVCSDTQFVVEFVCLPSVDKFTVEYGYIVPDKDVGLAATNECNSDGTYNKKFKQTLVIASDA